MKTLTTPQLDILKRALSYVQADFLAYNSAQAELEYVDIHAQVEHCRKLKSEFTTLTTMVEDEIQKRATKDPNDNTYEAVVTVAPSVHIKGRSMFEPCLRWIDKDDFARSTPLVVKPREYPPKPPQ
jgi:hypothetical protein